MVSFSGTMEMVTLQSLWCFLGEDIYPEAMVSHFFHMKKTLYQTIVIGRRKGIITR